MIKILLDTDIGNDVDDAVCLAYLLSHPQCHLLGITTVTGEPIKRASLASVICKVAGKDIPLYPGFAAPMMGELRQPIAQHATVLPHWPHQSDFPQDQAIDFMSQTIRANPGEVILLTIGPLTNIGRLFSADPDVAPLLKAIVLMGGLFTNTYPEKEYTEWNILCDPAAAEIVYRTPVKLHRSIGLDVTLQVAFPAQEVRQQFTAPLLRPVLDMAEIWFSQSSPTLTFHDPLAAATIFDPTLCQYQQGNVTVNTSDKPGQTHFTPATTTDAPHHIATTVAVQRYLDHFFGVFPI